MHNGAWEVATDASRGGDGLPRNTRPAVKRIRVAVGCAREECEHTHQVWVLMQEGEGVYVAPTGCDYCGGGFSRVELRAMVANIERGIQQHLRSGQCRDE